MKEKNQESSPFQGFHPLRELIEERKAGTLPIYKTVRKESAVKPELKEQIRKLREEQPKKKRLGTDVGVNIFDLLPEEDY
jgi:hypothetical protein